RAMAIGTCTPRARDLSQMTFSAIFRDARGQSLQCEQRDEYLQAIRSISVRACVECGKHRAWFSGIPLNENVMTAAHKSLPFRSKVKVTNKKNGHAVTVTHQCKKTFATISAISRLIGNVRSGA